MLDVADLADISSRCLQPNLLPIGGIRRIALIYEAKLPFDRNVMSGVASYVREVGRFNIYIEENPVSGQMLPYLRSWHGDGILADLDDPGVASALSRSGAPVVGFGCGWHSRSLSVPYFYSNQSAVGEMAADHLLERGFQNFAFCGFVPSPVNVWYEERQRAFVTRLQSSGIRCHVYQDSQKTPRGWDSILNSLGSWVKSLPKPVGILAANDKRARDILETCQLHHLRVPDDVGVMCVDNDELFRELSHPQLTSVEQNAKRIGYEAIALLDRMMAGMMPPQRHFIIAPIGVRVCRSTDILATDDRLVAKTMTVIKSDASDGIRVQDVVNSLAISRSSLEARFKAATGCTVHATIRRVQLEQARRLIFNTTFAIKEIAAETGFKSVQHMTTLFRKAFGQTPARYRKAGSALLLHQYQSADLRGLPRG
jgi:LacI family transcriptional regulator